MALRRAESDVTLKRRRTGPENNVSMLRLIREGKKKVRASTLPDPLAAAKRALEMTENVDKMIPSKIFNVLNTSTPTHHKCS